MSVPQLQNNGVSSNFSTAHTGSIYSAASQTQIDNSNKLNYLNTGVKGGKRMKLKRGGAAIEVSSGYTSVYPQGPVNTNGIGSSITSTQNQAFVQSNKDTVPLVQPGFKGGRKSKKGKSKRFKSRKNKSRKNRTRRNRK